MFLIKLNIVIRLDADFITTVITCRCIVLALFKNMVYHYESKKLHHTVISNDTISVDLSYIVW